MVGGVYQMQGLLPQRLESGNRLEKVGRQCKDGTECESERDFRVKSLGHGSKTSDSLRKNKVLLQGQEPRASLQQSQSQPSSRQVRERSGRHYRYLRGRA